MQSRGKSLFDCYPDPYSYTSIASGTDAPPHAPGPDACPCNAGHVTLATPGSLHNWPVALPSCHHSSPTHSSLLCPSSPCPSSLCPSLLTLPSPTGPDTWLTHPRQHTPKCLWPHPPHPHPSHPHPPPRRAHPHRCSPHPPGPDLWLTCPSQVASVPLSLLHPSPSIPPWPSTWERIGW